MARIRYIKPDFFNDEEISQLPFLERLAFIGLWCLADKRGRLVDSPTKIKAQLFSSDLSPINSKVNIESVLHSLTIKPFIIRYDIENKKYIQIVHFSKHQRPHHTEQDSSLPPPLTVKEPLDNGFLSVQEQEGMEKGMEKGSMEPESVSKPPFLVFQTNGKTKEWSLTFERFEELKILYPAVDLNIECRRAQDWCKNNPVKRKTNTGMNRFLTSWLNKAQNDPSRIKQEPKKEVIR